MSIPKLYSIARLSIEQVISIIWYDGMTQKLADTCIITVLPNLGIHSLGQENSSEKCGKEWASDRHMYALIEWQWCHSHLSLLMQVLNWFICIICHCGHPLLLPLHLTPVCPKSYHSLTQTTQTAFPCLTQSVFSVPRCPNRKKSFLPILFFQKHLLGLACHFNSKIPLQLPQALLISDCFPLPPCQAAWFLAPHAPSVSSYSLSVVGHFSKFSKNNFWNLDMSST